MSVLGLSKEPVPPQTVTPRGPNGECPTKTPEIVQLHPLRDRLGWLHGQLDLPPPSHLPRLREHLLCAVARADWIDDMDFMTLQKLPADHVDSGQQRHGNAGAPPSHRYPWGGAVSGLLIRPLLVHQG